MPAFSSLEIDTTAASLDALHRSAAGEGIARWAVPEGAPAPGNIRYSFAGADVLELVSHVETSKAA